MVEVGVLVALGALLVLAIVVAPADSDVGVPAPESVQAVEPEEPVSTAEAADAAPPISPAPTTAHTAPTEESTPNGPAPRSETSESAMTPPETLPDDDENVTDVTPTTKTPTLSPEPETNILRRSTTDFVIGFTALVEGPFLTIDVTRDFACGLLIGGRAECWGANTVGQTETTDSVYSAMDAGSWVGCGLRDDGGIECWGDLDDYAFDTHEGPFGSFAVGWGVVCAVRFDGVVICSAGEFDPYLHKPLDEYALTVTVGAGVFCAITEEHEAKCWDQFLLGSGRASPVVDAALPDGPFTELFIGQNDDIACGIRWDQSVSCWGFLALIGADDPPGRFSQLAVGVHHVCGLRPDRTIDCWSDGYYNQVGTPAGQFIDISVGWWYSCGVRESGELLCWDTETAERLPVPDGYFTAVESLEIENCALRRDGAAVCWPQPL